MVRRAPKESKSSFGGYLRLLKLLLVVPGSLAMLLWSNGLFQLSYPSQTFTLKRSPRQVKQLDLRAISPAVTVLSGGCGAVSYRDFREDLLAEVGWRGSFWMQEHGKHKGDRGMIEFEYNRSVSR